MPYIILFTMICPVGAEGTTFALLTTTSALAGAVSSAIGGYMSIIWDVSNSTLAAQDFSGVIKVIF
jgi:BT1 family